MIKKAGISKKLKISNRQLLNPSSAVVPADLLAMNSATVLDNISEHIIHLDLENKIIWANRAAAESLGKDSQKIIGKYCYKLWHKRQSPCTDCPIVMARKTGQEQVGELTSPDGRIWLVKGSPIKNEEGKVTSVIEVTREITEDKKAECQEAQSLQDKAVISEIAAQLAKASDSETVYKLLGQGLLKLAGDSISIISSYDQADSSLVVREIVGKPKNLKFIWKIFSKSIIGSRFRDIPAKAFKSFRQSRLMPLKGGLAGVSFGKLPKRSIKTLLNKIDPKEIYTMGLLYGQNVLGALVICLLNEKRLLNKDVLENLVNRAATALQRVKGESERRYSQDYFKALIDHTTEIITILDGDGGIKFESPSVKQALGYDAEEMIGRNILDFVHPEDVPGLILKFNQEIYQTETISKFEIRFKHKNGTWQTLDATSSNLMDNPLVNGLVISSRNITQRKESELALKQSEAVLKESQRKLELLMSNLPGMVYRCRNDRNWTMEITNEACRDLTGYDPVDIIANKTISFAQLIHPADREMVWDDIQIAVQKKEAYQLIFRIIARDGLEKWVWAQGQGVYNEKGTLQALEGFIADISERKRAEEALHTSEYQYRSTIDSLSDSIHVVDAKLSIMLTNRVFKEWNKMLGLASEAVGRNIFEIYPFLSRDKVAEEYQRVLDSGKILITVEENSVNNKRIVTETRKIPIFENDKAVRVITVVHDITESKLAEEKLRETEEMYRAVTDATNTGFLIIDAAGRVQGANDEYVRLTGHRMLKDILGRSVADWTAPHDLQRNRDEVEKCMRIGSVRMLEIDYQHRNGTIIPIEINATVVQRTSGPVIITLCRDISARKLSEQRLKESESNYRQIFDGIAEGIYRSASDGRVLLVNPALARMLGFEEPEEMVDFNTNQDGYIDPNTHRIFLGKMERDGSVKNMVSEWRKKDGSILVAKENAHAVKDEAGNIMFYEGTVEDITEKKRAEDALRTSEYQYRTTIDSMGDAIHVVDRDLRIILCNRIFVQWCRDLNLEQEVLNKDIFELCPFLNQRTREEYETVFSTKKVLVSQETNEVAGRVMATETRKIPVFEDEKVIRVITVMRDITEQKKSEQKLIESEEKYRQIFEGIAEGIYRSTPDGRVLLSNPALVRMLGYSSIEELTQRDIRREGFSDPKARRQFLDLIEKNGQVKDLISQWRRDDGTEVTVKENAHAVRDSSGKTLYYEGTVEDITEQKKNEYAFRQNEQRYKALADSSPDLVFVIDRQAKIKYANDRAASVVGLAGEQAIGRSITEFFPQHINQVQQVQLMEVFEKGRAAHYELPTPVGDRVMWLETWLVPMTDENGSVKEVMGVCRDLTERVNMEKALKESEEKYRQIFEGISEGIYRSTPDGKLLFANPSLIRMLGYKNLEDVQGIDINVRVYLDQGTREKFAKQIEQNGEVIGFESEMMSKDGSVITVSENARLVRDDQGNPLYYEGTLEDITQRKKIEKALVGEKNKLEHLFNVGLSVAKSPTLQGKLDLTIKGIKECHLFDKAVIVLEDKNGYRSHIAHYGLNRREVEHIEKSPVTSDEDKAKVFIDKYRISNSYLFPHDDINVHQYFAARLVDNEYQPNGSWHPEDVLIVPLTIKGKNVGYLSVDEPIDGNRPGLETIHLLELFANQAAIAVENIRLYNDLERSYYDTLKAFVAAMDAKDPYTKGHSENVRHYALKIAKHIGLAEEKLKLIDYSSLLHDIGKLGVREYILSKPDVLSSAEYQEVKLHPVIGSRLVSEIEALSQIVDIIYSHHEYYDGTGYPRGISGELIPLESRIIAVADAFEAMTSDRPYRKAFSFQVALQRLQDAAGTQFDIEIVRAFTELFRQESELERSGEYV